MAVPTTYAELCENIATWMVRDDLEDMIPEFVQAAEARFNRVLRLPEMEEVASSAIVDGTVTLPTDFLEARSVRLDTSPVVVLEQMALSQMREWYAGDTSGKPQNFALQSGVEIVFGPAPSGEYTVILNYYAKIPALASDNTSNWLLVSHPDLYRAAALAEGFAFTVDQERGQLWESRAQVKMAELIAQARKNAFSGAPLRSRPTTFA